MNRQELIQQIKDMIANGEITDIESYVYASQNSRTKAKSVLRSNLYTEVKVRKQTIYIKN